MQTGLAFLPLAVATGAGAHVGSHLVGPRGVRLPLAGAFAVPAAGLLLLAGVDAGGSYVADVLPGVLMTGVGLGVALVVRRRLRAHGRARSTRPGCCRG